jgi:hypothetical protein
MIGFLKLERRGGRLGKYIIDLNQIVSGKETSFGNARSRRRK